MGKPKRKEVTTEYPLNPRPNYFKVTHSLTEMYE
jgi:hypothetical protein